MTTPPTPAAEMLELAAKASPGPWVEDVSNGEQAVIRADAERFLMCSFFEARIKWREDRALIARSRTLGPLLAQQVVELTAALETMVYEATHLSPEQDDGSHWAKISKAALTKARSALAGKPQTQELGCGAER